MLDSQDILLLHSHEHELAAFKAILLKNYANIINYMCLEPPMLEYVEGLILSQQTNSCLQV